MRLEVDASKEFLSVREICGPALARLHEGWRMEVLIELENADTDEKRLVLQSIAVMHRDLAARWRDDEATVREKVLDTDRAQHPEGAP